MSTLVEVERLRVTKDHRCICAIDELMIDRGECLLIVGGNGSGKTTLLRVLARLERDYVGSCAWNVTPLDCIYAQQSPYMFRGSTLFNATYGLAARGAPRSTRTTTAMQWLERLGVEQLARQRATALSGGERRRVALARAFALQPALLLLDEPFADLDEDGVAAVNACLEMLAESSTIVIASPTELSHGLPARVVHMEVPSDP